MQENAKIFLIYAQKRIPIIMIIKTTLLRNLAKSIYRSLDLLF